MHARANRLAERVRPWLGKQGAVLDYGCGTGHNAMALRRVCRREVLEMDVADLKTIGPPAVLVPGPIPLDSGSISSCVLLFVLNYTADPAQVFRELRRVTSERLVIVQAVARSPRFRRLLHAREILEGGIAWDIARAMRWIGNGRDGLVARSGLTRTELIDMAEAAGWCLIRNEPEPGWRKRRWLSRDLFVFEPAAMPEQSKVGAVQAPVTCKPS